jgi:ABC-type glycerol-3-phosphate transport system substrate-binding protein
MTQLTVTGPYVNKTLFEQAEVAMPGEGATWDDWAAAVNQVAEKLDIPDPNGLGPFRPPRFRTGYCHGCADV